MSNKKKKKEENIEEVEQEINDIEYEIDEEFVEESGIQNKLKKMREQLKAEKQKSQEYLTGWQTERADFVNYKNQEEEKKKERLKNMKLDLVMDFFPVLDSFDMAFSNKKAWEKVDSAWRTGVEYIYSQFLKVLENYHIQVIDEVGISFNPQIHDPVDTIETGKKEESDKVAEIVQKGYYSGELVLRPAKVKLYQYGTTK